MRKSQCPVWLGSAHHKIKDLAAATENQKLPCQQYVSKFGACERRREEGRAHRSEVPLDTLGKLADRGHRLFGSCLDCALSYRPELGPRNRTSQFDIDLGALIAERGRECEIVGMRRVPCPRCGGRRTEIRVLPP